MLDFESDPTLRRLLRIARLRVTVGFIVAGVGFWFATPTWTSLGIGALVAAVGEAVRVWAAGHLKKEQEVTSSGPYRFTRHPLYLGSLIIGAGFVVAAANAVVAVVVLGYLAVVLWVAITLEEAILRDAFGTVYDDYARGDLESSRRPFSLTRAVQNGEHQALLGFAASLGLLALKAL